ncbi:MAG TPA: molybdenum cofactor guanylyltransferase [Candidatus Eremiobacteraceae bacterium]|nr:molybdenum cofactor guanylyltransferase [Candidatus Eremiobacteraceae bacterium]
MSRENAVTIVLLAGGRATRLPGKLTRTIGDEPMIVRVYRKLTGAGRPCVVSVREPLPAAIAERISAPMVQDAYGDAGPLGGLASAAAQVRTPLLFAAAGDLPNVDALIVDALEERYRQETQRSGVAPDVILPRHPNGDVEPLAALYDTTALRASAVRSLAIGQKKVTQALEGLRVIHYDIAAAEAIKFINVNTLQDLAGIETG